jgi:predicted membrane channel-forming protein YqfA (hemolysin III family)
VTGPSGWARVAWWFIVAVWVYGAIGIFVQVFTPAWRRIRFEYRDRKRRRQLRARFQAKYLR